MQVVTIEVTKGIEPYITAVVCNHAPGPPRLRHHSVFLSACRKFRRRLRTTPCYRLTLRRRGVDREGFEPSILVCNTSVFPLTLTAQSGRYRPLRDLSNSLSDLPRNCPSSVTELVLLPGPKVMWLVVPHMTFGGYSKLAFRPGLYPAPLPERGSVLLS